MKQIILIVICMGLLLCTPVTESETLYEAEVNDQIDEITYRFRREGFVKLGSTWIDELEEDADDYITVELYEGYEYIAVAVCDDDCGDIDLVLYDDNDEKIARDISDDDVPIIAGEPDYDGRYFLEAQMVDCETDTCAFGVAIFARH